jgi:hypothetical protein
VTQQIKALEDEFGVPLFDRGGGHIALAAGGKALLPFAKKMKELSDQVVASVAEALVRVTACSGNTDEMLEALLAHKIDLTLIEGPGNVRTFISSRSRKTTWSWWSRRTMAGLITMLRWKI